LTTFPRQNDQWNSYNSEFCFISHDKSGYYQTFLWLAGLILNFPLLIEWCLLRFFALVAWGDDQSMTVILSLFGFGAWNSYDLIDLKLSNADLATDESGWGFGQVFPLASLGLILLNIMDAVQSELPKADVHLLEIY
jgi:hypothetical protein